MVKSEIVLPLITGIIFDTKGQDSNYSQLTQSALKIDVSQVMGTMRNSNDS